MKEILLHNGKGKALVDDIDYDDLCQYRWYLRRRSNPLAPQYAVRIDKNGIRLGMHRHIMHVADGECVDHRNRNGLDNRRANLRVASRAENMRNRCGNHGKTTSNYKGVYWDARRTRWVAQIYHLGRRITKYLKTEREAARVYDQMALQYYGEFAWLNFPVQEAMG